MKIAKWVLVLATLAMCAAANAGLRCNGDIADVGDSKASVILKCGDPFFAETFCKPAKEFLLPASSDERTMFIALPCIPVDEWSYNPGSGSFLTIMRFEAGTLTSIRYGIP